MTADQWLDCAMCSREIHVNTLCEHDDPMCPLDCSLYHGEQALAEWIGRGWVA